MYPATMHMNWLKESYVSFMEVEPLLDQPSFWKKFLSDWPMAKLVTSSHAVRISKKMHTCLSTLAAYRTGRSSQSLVLT